MSANVLLYEAAHLLKQHYHNSEEIVQRVMHHAIAAAGSAAASGCLPGAGSTIAATISIGIIVKMYVSLGKMLGVKIGHGVLKALASAVVADLVGVVAASIAVTAVISFVPGIGTVGSAVLTGITSFCYVYLAGLIYIKMVGKLLNSGKSIENMSEQELKEALKETADSINMKDAMKEARSAYKDMKK